MERKIPRIPYIVRPRIRRTAAVRHVAPKTPWISRIEVTKLFGLYDYDVSVRDAEEASGRLVVLYGDNGCGKTTILRLVYHLLAPEDTQGHRTFVGSVSFQRFAVTIGGDTIVEAFRPKNETTGSFTWRISKKTKVLAEVKAPVRDGAVRISNASTTLKAKWEGFMRVLTWLHLATSYLPDDRKPESLQEVGDEERMFIFEGVEPEQVLRRTSRFAEKHHPILQAALQRTEEHIRQEALQATNSGEADTNKIYAEIVKRIAKGGDDVQNLKEQSEKLILELTQMQERSRAYSSVGLISEFSASEIISTLEKVQRGRAPILLEILRPYVNGVAARLNALHSVQDLIHTFVQGVNGFFSNKRISFELGSGIRIVSQNGEELAPHLLSSGEKQLLLLFCNTIVARGRATIFLIDEPEISLNVKWQRKLLAALLSLVRGTPVQFLIATHSVELLTQFSENVQTLRHGPTEKH